MSKQDEFKQEVFDKIMKKKQKNQKPKKTDNRKAYYNDNIDYVFETLGYDEKDPKLEKIVQDHKKLHPINVNDNTYKQIKRIKQEHKIFSKNIVGMGIYLLYEMLYGDEFEIVKKDKNPNEKNR